MIAIITDAVNRNDNDQPEIQYSLDNNTDVSLLGRISLPEAVYLTERCIGTSLDTAYLSMLNTFVAQAEQNDPDYGDLIGITFSDDLTD